MYDYIMETEATVEQLEQWAAEEAAACADEPVDLYGGDADMQEYGDGW